MWLDEFLAAYIVLFMTSVETNRSGFPIQRELHLQKSYKSPMLLKVCLNK